VHGKPPELAAELRSHLSLWTLSEPATDLADPKVRQALQSQPRLPDGKGTLLRKQGHSVVSVEVTAQGPSGATFSRSAVIETNPNLERGYKILAWDWRDADQSSLVE
jgi:hypothetical protein